MVTSKFHALYIYLELKTVVNNHLNSSSSKFTLICISNALICTVLQFGSIHIIVKPFFQPIS